MAWKALLGTSEAAEEASHQLAALISDNEVKSIMRHGGASEARDIVLQTARRLIETDQIDVAFQLLEALPDRDTHDGRPRGTAYMQIMELLPSDRIADAAHRALQSLQVIDDETEQVTALSALAKHLPGPIRGELISKCLALAHRGLTIDEKARRLMALLPLLADKLAEDITNELLSMLPEIDDYHRSQIWAVLSQCLTSASIESVHKMLVNTAIPESLRTWLLERAIPLLDDMQLVSALQHARDLEEVQLQTRALAAIVPRLLPPQRDEVVSGLLGRIEQLQAYDPAGFSPRASAFVHVAPVLHEELIPRAAAIVDSVTTLTGGEEMPWECIEAVSALALRAAELGYHELALHYCRVLPTLSRGRALARIVPQLPAAMLDDAEEIAKTQEQYFRRDLAVALARRIADGHMTPYLREAVWAAATPPVRGGGAYDMTSTLDDLAPAITPEVLTTVLEHAKEAQSASVRALVPVYLARFLPIADRQAVYSRALAEAESTDNEDDRAGLLGQIAPLLPASLFPRSVEDIANIQRPGYLYVNSRAEALAAVTPRLLQLSAADCSTVVRTIIRAAATRPRKEMLWDLSAMAPVIEHVGGPGLLEAVARGVIQATDYWP
jgi:hypothetical protein